MTGLTRAAAARIIAGHFGTQATHVGGGYDTYTVRDNQNRQWKLVSDASIRCRNGNNRSASRDYSVEFVSPICQYEDIETIQELVRKAVTESSAQFYAAHRQPEPQQTLFDMDEDEDFSYEPEDYEDEPTEDEPEMDESDPFYFSEGMHL